MGCLLITAVYTCVITATFVEEMPVCSEVLFRRILFASVNNMSKQCKSLQTFVVAVQAQT